MFVSGSLTRIDLYMGGKWGEKGEKKEKEEEREHLAPDGPHACGPRVYVNPKWPQVCVNLGTFPNLPLESHQVSCTDHTNMATSVPTSHQPSPPEPGCRLPSMPAFPQRCWGAGQEGAPAVPVSLSWASSSWTLS